LPRCIATSALAVLACSLNVDCVGGSSKNASERERLKALVTGWNYHPKLAQGVEKGGGLKMRAGKTA